MDSKVRHWTGERDSGGRQVYEEHQGRTQVYDTAEIWKAAVNSEMYTATTKCAAGVIVFATIFTRRGTSLHLKLHVRR